MSQNESNNKIKVVVISSKKTDTYLVDAPFSLKKLKDLGSDIRFCCRLAECGSCLIEIVDGIDGVNKVDKLEKKFLKSIGSRPNERLACRCTADKDISIKIVNEEEND